MAVPASALAWFLSCPFAFPLRFDRTGAGAELVEAAVAEAVRKYMVDESSLGFVAPLGYSGVSGRSLPLPVAVYDSATLAALCALIVAPVDGYVFVLTDTAHVKTELVRTLECFNTTTPKLKTKRLLLADVGGKPLECERFRDHFEWLWAEYGSPNVVAVAPCVREGRPPSLATLGHDPFSGRLLAFGPDDDVAGVMKARFDDLHGHRVRALLFPLGMGADTLLINDSASIRGGPDATLRWALEARFNLSFDVSRPRDGVLNGFVLNGTHHGSLADVINDHVEINLVVKTVKWYGTDRIQFLAPRLYGSLVVLVRARGRVRGWRVIAHVFTADVWASVAAAVVATCGVATALAAARPRRHADLAKPLPLVLKSVLSIGVRRPPRSGPERLLMASCLLFGVVVLNLFFGQFFSLIKTKPRLAEIDTFEELRDADVPIYTTYRNFLDAFDATEGTPLEALRARLALRAFGDDGGPWLGAPEFAGDWEFAVLIGDFELQMQSMMLPREAMERFHVLREEVLLMNIAHIMPIASVYFDRFNLFSIALYEYGFFQHWHAQYMLYVREKHPPPPPPSAGRGAGADPLTVSDLRLAFVVLIAGLLLATVCFAVEIVVNKLAEDARCLAFSRRFDRWGRFAVALRSFPSRNIPRNIPSGPN